MKFPKREAESRVQVDPFSDPLHALMKNSCQIHLALRS